MQTLQANESSSLELVLIIFFSAGKQRDALHHSQIFDSLEFFFLSCINHVLSRTQADKIDHVPHLLPHGIIQERANLQPQVREYQQDIQALPRRRVRQLHPRPLQVVAGPLAS